MDFRCEKSGSVSSMSAATTSCSGDSVKLSTFPGAFGPKVLSTTVRRSRTIGLTTLSRRCDKLKVCAELLLGCRNRGFHELALASVVCSPDDRPHSHPEDIPDVLHTLPLVGLWISVSAVVKDRMHGFKRIMLPAPEVPFMVLIGDASIQAIEKSFPFCWIALRRDGFRAVARLTQQALCAAVSTALLRGMPISQHLESCTLQESLQKTS